MSIVNRQPVQVPLVDPKTGIVTREWYRFFDQVFVRVGGTEGQTNTELVQDQYADAGIEETKHETFKALDALNQLPPIEPSKQQDDQAPPGAFFVPTQDDQHARIEALEAQVALLLQAVSALQQGYQL